MEEIERNNKTRYAARDENRLKYAMSNALTS